MTTTVFDLDKFKESTRQQWQMTSLLNEKEKVEMWEEISREMGQFEMGGRLNGPCESVIASRAK